MDDTPVCCRRCDRQAVLPLPTWSLETEHGRRSWLCDTCTRDNLRAIEGKLDDAWW